MENCRNHYFPGDDCTVVTGMCPNGQYGAYREQDDGRVRGYGHSRLAAIADLVEALELVGSIYEREAESDVLPPSNIRPVSVRGLVSSDH